MNKYIELNPKLSKDEKKLLSDAYKNIISDKRNSLHILLNLSQKDDSKQPNRTKEISIIKEKITIELKSIFQQVHSMLDKYLIPNAQDNESKIFYMKLKADFYRYHCEFAVGDEFEEISNKATPTVICRPREAPRRFPNRSCRDYSQSYRKFLRIVFHRRQEYR